MNQNDPKTLYLSLESTIKATARLMSLNWRVDTNDLLSVANEGFMSALATFEDGKGCTLKSWCISVIKSNLRDECRKQKLQNKRFSAFSSLESETLDLDNILKESVLETSSEIETIELQSELRKFSKSAQKYALTRMRGYNAHEIAKFRMMSRREILNAKKEIEKCHK